MDVERERVCRLEKGRGLEEPFSFLERERERERGEKKETFVCKLCFHHPCKLRSICLIAAWLLCHVSKLQILAQFCSLLDHHLFLEKATSGSNHLQ
jgi:hypothetical protein